MGQYVEYYCRNNAKELIRVSNSVIRRMFADLPQMYYDDLYSIAAMTVFDCEERYTEEKCTHFEAFFISCLERKFLTEQIARSRDKRCNTEKDHRGRTKKDDKGIPVIVYNISLETPLNEEGILLGDIIPSSENLEREIIEDKREEYSEKMKRYLDKLSNLQRNILRLIAAGYEKAEIIEELHINHEEYIRCEAAIHAYRNISILL